MHRPGRRASYPLITLAVPFLSWLLIVETHPFSFTICRPVSLQRARFLMTRHLSGHSLWNSKVVAEEVLFHSPAKALSVCYLTVRVISACLTPRNGCGRSAGIWHSSCGSEAGGAKPVCTSCSGSFALSWPFIS